MPQIKEYTAENDVLRPSDRGVESFGQAARRVGSFYGQAGEVLKQSAQERARAAEAVARASEATARGEESTAQAGEARARAVGALATEEKAKAGAFGGLATTAGTVFEQAENYAAHREISPAVAGFAEASNGMIQKWKDLVGQQTTNDPNNSSIRSGFLQGTFEPWAQNFVKAFRTPQGQDWANEQVNHLRNHLVETTAADMSTMAGVATGVNLDRTAAAHANEARTDPSSLPRLLGDPDAKQHTGESDQEYRGRKAGQIDRDYDAIISTSGMTGTQAYKARLEGAEKARQDALRAGALGGIEQSNDPVGFAQNFNKRWSGIYDDPMLADAIEKAGKTQERANYLDQERARKQLKEQDEDASDKRVDDYIKDQAGAYPKAKLQDAIADKQLTRKDREHVINMIRRNDRPETDAHISQQNSLEIMGDIRRGQMTDDQILDRYEKGDLTKADLGFLRNELAGRKTPEGQALTAQRDLFMKRIGTRVDPDQGLNPATAGNAYLFEMAARAREADLKSKGIDPREAYDPASTNYFGKEENIQKYKVPYQQQLQNMQEEMKQTKNRQSLPEALQKIPDLEHNKDWTQFRDPTTKKRYDAKGNEIGGAAPAANVPIR